MNIEKPTANDLPALKALWAEAFGDTEEFISLFFTRGFAPERCRCIKKDGILAALYWFDCPWMGKKLAYIYGVATRKDARGNGLCAALMENTHQHLKESGYAGAVLVPAKADLRTYYRRFGYENCGGVKEITATATAPVSVQPVSTEAYSAMRQTLLPEKGVALQGEMLTFFSHLAAFYAGDGFLFAAAWEDGKLRLPELLGHCPDLGGIAAALNADSVTCRVPGETEFAMYLPFDGTEAPGYFGIALD